MVISEEYWHGRHTGVPKAFHVNAFRFEVLLG
jgi:hypothetical protein